ncbi:MAG: ribonuclease J [Pseudomonadota bacterium]
MKLPKDTLVFVPLGGTGEIGMNMSLYGWNDSWIMVDCGMSFPQARDPGVELIFPDPAFAESLGNKLKALVLTHGHEDHGGAVPYLWPDLGVPLYATPFTMAMMRHKLADHGLDMKDDLVELPIGADVEIGPFKITYVALSHSIAEGHGLFIETPAGNVFHTGDWKLDDEPIVGEAALPAALTALGDRGIMALVGDSTNAMNETASGSEGDVRTSMLEIFAGVKGRLVITTFASNIARLETIGEVAKATHRHLVVMGRSLQRNIALGKATGYLEHFPPTLDQSEAQHLPRSKVLILCTGCQGEPRAALSRIALNEHRDISLAAGDTVAFSSKIIPGNEKTLGALFNALAANDINIITEKDAFIHVSGHPGRPQIKQLYGWLRPQALIPVHGEMVHMKAHAALAHDLGISNTYVPLNGDVIQLNANRLTRIGYAPANYLALDGDEIVLRDGASIVDRRRMAQNGAAIISLVMDDVGDLLDDPIIHLQGVPGQEDAELSDVCLDAIEATLRKQSRYLPKDRDGLAEKLRIAVRRALRSYTGKNPQTRVLIHAV